MDVSGEQQLDVEHNLFKRRLAKDGTHIDEQKQETLGDPSSDVAPVLKSLTDLDPDRCESCYGAETKDLKCV